MTGIYLKCDSCGDTIGGEKATDRWGGLIWCEAQTLQDYARSIGWTGPLTRESSTDKCPECSIKIKVSIRYGHIELKQFNRYENGCMVTYGYSIDYDRDGREVSRTEPTKVGSIGWSDGTPFTEEDCRNLSPKVQ